MTSSKKSGKLKKADVLALLNPEIKPDFDALSPASSVASGPDTPSILASDHLSKALVKKLEGKTAKLIAKRQRLDNAVDAERALLSGGRPAAAASPAWSRNMEALLERVERLSAKEMSHMADLATKLGLAEDALAQKETTKKRKAVETMRKIHHRFRKHLEPYFDYPIKSDKSGAKNEEASDEDTKTDVESLQGSDEDEVAEDAKTTLEKEFERATRHMNLDDYDSTDMPSDVEEAIMRSAAKRVMTGGFKPINAQPYHNHATANHSFTFGVDDDPFFDDDEKKTPGKSKKDEKDKKKDKKRKRESEAAAAEVSDVETPKKKSKKSKKRKTELKQESANDGKHEASSSEHSPKKAKKAKKAKKSKKVKKSKKDHDTSPVWTDPRRYSTSVIPLPVIPPQALAHITQSASKQIAAPTGPPVPVAAPVAPNSSRRRSFGPFSSPKKRVFSSIRNSPPPLMGVATPEPKQWILEGDTSRARAKSTTSKITMTIGAHPPILPDGVREASPAEVAGQKRRPGRPKGSKTESRKAVMAGSPPLISTTPIPLPTYATRPHDEDLVRMVIPDAFGRPVLASSPPRGNMTLVDRLQQDRAMYAEERARWFQLMGIPDPAPRV